MLNLISFYLILRPQRLTDSCHVFIHLCLLHSSTPVCCILPCVFLFFLRTAHISADNLLLNLLLVHIRYFSCRFLLNLVGFFKSDSPFQKQFQFCFHGVAACFGYNKISFGQ